MVRWQELLPAEYWTHFFAELSHGLVQYFSQFPLKFCAAVSDNSQIEVLHAIFLSDRVVWTLTLTCLRLISSETEIPSCGRYLGGM